MVAISGVITLPLVTGCTVTGDRAGRDEWNPNPGDAGYVQLSQLQARGESFKVNAAGYTKKVADAAPAGCGTSTVPFIQDTPKVISSASVEDRNGRVDYVGEIESTSVADCATGNEKRGFTERERAISEAYRTSRGIDPQ